MIRFLLLTSKILNALSVKPAVMKSLKLSIALASNPQKIAAITPQRKILQEPLILDYGLKVSQPHPGHGDARHHMETAVKSLGR